ncbi:type II secretion system protein [Phragmitibacter flavus]|uniref:Type II secretion system protein n=1 Tax=Phragmitibacter flavus TaxID=2576071 RepID=A0A5R8KIA6_9BACT|nr:type II secretion system protein [Phragmitibacter flavus]TLD71987.1 type II secretion system protein [Phragmitibacter flavus]
MKIYRSYVNAFTLLELLVVVSIIGVLAALAVPVSQRVLHQARSSHCIGNLRQLGAAVNLHLAENNNFLPTLEAGRSSKDDDVAVIDNTYDAYTEDGDEVFCCKADHKNLFETTGTSYMWNHLINGQNVASLEFMGFIRNSTRIPVIGDKEGFHHFRDVRVNILYADGHVAKEIQFLVAEP